MKQKIKEATETTLVVDNKQSIDLCVDKIINSIKDQKQSDAVEFAINYAEWAEEITPMKNQDCFNKTIGKSG